ncbi:hypothetical protein RRG08_038829 [Elysia crispata]|uniref:Uncharacterized protein n=1 Tax=Elysia crispata TaxID=231223 RepID=A0AAE0YSR0_9GAST|nr:hypothetical protein RRG08_038829 [Elysia crispata]
MHIDLHPFIVCKAQGRQDVELRDSRCELLFLRQQLVRSNTSAQRLLDVCLARHMWNISDLLLAGPLCLLLLESIILHRYLHRLQTLIIITFSFDFFFASDRL